jgi:hypothetical protein
MDSGIGMELFAIFKKESEDPRITYAALNAICNLVNEFSPLRPVRLTFLPNKCLSESLLRDYWPKGSFHD